MKRKQVGGLLAVAAAAVLIAGCSDGGLDGLVRAEQQESGAVPVFRQPAIDGDVEEDAAGEAEVLENEIARLRQEMAAALKKSQEKDDGVALLEKFLDELKDQDDGEREDLEGQLEAAKAEAEKSKGDLAKVQEMVAKLEEQLKEKETPVKSGGVPKQTESSGTTPAQKSEDLVRDLTITHIDVDGNDADSPESRFNYNKQWFAIILTDGELTCNLSQYDGDEVYGTNGFEECVKPPSVLAAFVFDGRRCIAGHSEEYCKGLSFREIQQGDRNVRDIQRAYILLHDDDDATNFDINLVSFDIRSGNSGTTVSGGTLEVSGNWAFSLIDSAIW